MNTRPSHRARTLPHALRELFDNIKSLAVNISLRKEQFPRINNLTLEDLYARYDSAATGESLTFTEWAWRRDEDRVVLEWLYMQAANKAEERLYPLHWAIACRKNLHFIRKRAIEEGYSLSIRHHDMSPLDIAVKCNDDTRLGWLIELIDDSDDRQTLLSKALYHAIADGYAIITARLTNAGADLSYTDQNGNNALHIAMQLGHASLAMVLREKLNQDDINRPNHRGDTAAHLLARNQDQNNAKHLLYSLRNDRLHEDPNLQNQKGETPFSIAAANGNKTLIECWLREHIAAESHHQISPYSFDAALIAAARNGHDSIIELVAPYTEDKLPALRAAISAGRDGAARILIPDIRIETECADKEGSALYLAAKHSRHDVVTQLCAARLDSYMAKRIKEQEEHEGEEHRHRLFGRGTGCPASRKIEAALTYKLVIQGLEPDTALDEYEKELSTSDLKGLKVLVDKYAVNRFQPASLSRSSANLGDRLSQVFSRLSGASDKPASPDRKSSNLTP